MSHTVTVDIKIKNMDALRKAAEHMEATILGEGNHKLYSSSHSGLGVQLKGWQYPIVIGTDGVVHYDNYNGRWGNQADLTVLSDGYAQAAVELECERLGWYFEKSDTGEMVVHHPTGGTITVGKGGQLDAQGFHGVSCQDATLPLEQAMGLRLGESIKPEMNEVQLTQNQVAE